MLGFDMRHAAGGRQRGGGRLGEQVNEQRLVCGDTGTEPGSLDSPDEYGARSTYTLPWNLLAAKRTVQYSSRCRCFSPAVHVRYGGRQQRPAQRNNLMPTTPAALSTTWRLIILLEPALHSSHLPLAGPFCLSSSDLATKRRTR